MASCFSLTMKRRFFTLRRQVFGRALTTGLSMTRGLGRADWRCLRACLGRGRSVASTFGAAMSPGGVTSGALHLVWKMQSPRGAGAKEFRCDRSLLLLRKVGFMGALSSGRANDSDLTGTFSTGRVMAQAGELDLACLYRRSWMDFALTLPRCSRFTRMGRLTTVRGVNSPQGLSVIK